MFLLILAHPGSPGQRAIKRLLLLYFEVTGLLVSQHSIHCNETVHDSMSFMWKL